MINESSNDEAIIVFVKNPVSGKVKTRLAAFTGELAALDIYNQLVTCIKKNLTGSIWPVYIFYSDKVEPGDRWPVSRYIKDVQTGIDLGERMSAAFRSVLARHKKVVLTGSDCPMVDKNILEQALQALDLVDVVLGPAEDGGYYLIGMKTVHDILFRNMVWSTGDVLVSTLKKAEDNHLAVFQLPVLRDVDDEKDLRYYAEKGVLTWPLPL